MSLHAKSHTTEVLQSKIVEIIGKILTQYQSCQQGRAEKFFEKSASAEGIIILEDTGHAPPGKVLSLLQLRNYLQLAFLHVGYNGCSAAA